MKPKSAKQKGRRLEETWVDLVKQFKLDPYSYVRADSGSGHKKEDTTHFHLPLFVEAKNRETWKPLAWFNEAAGKNTSYGLTTILVLGKNRLAMPFVFLPADDFMRICQFAKEGGWYALPKYPKKVQINYKKIKKNASKQSWRSKVRQKNKSKNEMKKKEIIELDTLSSFSKLKV
jgi:hypothetical protein